MTEDQAKIIINKIIDNNELWYLYLGVYYGYPCCCIFNFLNHNDARSDNSYPLNGTGFIPCNHCYRNKSITQLISEISNNRLCHNKFPKEIRAIYNLNPNTDEMINSINKYVERLLLMDFNLFDLDGQPFFKKETKNEDQ